MASTIKNILEPLTSANKQTAISQHITTMSTNTKTVFAVGNGACSDVCLEDAKQKFQTVRSTLVSILATKKDMMELSEKEEFLRVDEGLCSIVRGGPSRISSEETIKLARKLLKAYGKNNIL